MAFARRELPPPCGQTPQPPRQKGADAQAEEGGTHAQDHIEKHGLPQHAAGIILPVGPQILGDLDGEGSVQAHQNTVEQPGAGADDADGSGSFCTDVAHHGSVDVSHGSDHQLLQNGGDAQRQSHLGRLAGGDGLTLPHPGRKLFK